MVELHEDYCQNCGRTLGSPSCCRSSQTQNFLKCFLSAPKFSVRAYRDSKVFDVNEYTFVNMQLQTALKTIEPFWFLNLENEWEQIRPDGIAKTYPFSEGYKPEGPMNMCGLHLSGDLTMKLLRAQPGSKC